MTVEQLKPQPIANRVELAVQTLWNAMDELLALPPEELVDYRMTDAQGRTLGPMAMFDAWRDDLVRKKIEVNNVQASRPPYNQFR